MFVAAFAEVRKRLRLLDPAHVREWNTKQVVNWTTFTGIDRRLVRSFEQQKTDGSGLLQLQSLSAQVAMLVLDIDGSFTPQAPQKPSTPMPSLDQTHSIGLPTSPRPPLQRAVSAGASTLQRLSRERYGETPAITEEAAFEQIDEPSMLGVEQDIPPPHTCEEGEHCQTFIDRQELLNNLRDQYDVEIDDNHSGPIVLVNQSGRITVVDAASPVPVHPLWSVQTVPLSPCSAKSPVRQSLQEADMMWLGRRDPQEAVSAYLDAQLQQASPSQHAPRLLRSVTAPSPPIFSTLEAARPMAVTPALASSILHPEVPLYTASTTHDASDPFVSHPGPVTWSTYQRPSLAISTHGHAASLSSGSALSPIKRPGEPLSFTRSLSNSPIASRTPVTPVAQTLASLSGSPLGLTQHSSSGRRPSIIARSRSESPLAPRTPVTPASQVLAPVFESTFGLAQNTVSGGKPSVVTRSRSESPLASRVPAIERSGSASSRLGLPTLAELSLRDTLPPPNVSLTSQSPPRFSPLRSARSSLDLRPRAFRSATAPTTPSRASLDDTQPIIPINDWSPSRRPRRSQSFNTRTILSTVDERNHSLNQLEILPEVGAARSNPAASTATGPEVAYSGWMRQRKTRLLRHEWVLRFYRLTGTLLTVHTSDAHVHATPLKTYDIFEHSITSEGPATRTKLNVWMKRLKLSAPPPEDRPFNFEVVPNVFMLGPQDQTQGTRRLKVRYFTVDSNEVRQDWLRYVMHATNDRRLVEGIVTRVNGEDWTERE
jgi:hypothetical protein